MKHLLTFWILILGLTAVLPLTKLKAELAPGPIGEVNNERHHNPNGEHPQHGPFRQDFFGELSKEERQRVRKAMTKAWTEAEVKEARQHVQEATKAYHDILRQSMEKTGPWYWCYSGQKQAA